MAKYKERMQTSFDLFKPIRQGSCAEFVYNALGSIGRLKDEGRKYFGEDSAEWKKWEKECTNLWKLVNYLHSKIEIDKVDLCDSITEFADKFDHAAMKLHQVLSSHEIPERDRAKVINSIHHWCSIVYRFSVNAIILAYRDAKRKNLKS